jgi:hypothetical protein
MDSGAPSFLRNVPLFADISPEVLARLEHWRRGREFAPRAGRALLAGPRHDGRPGRPPGCRQSPRRHRVYRGRDCNVCGGKGVGGRGGGLYDVMKMTPRLRGRVGTPARAEEIHAAALEEGMIDLKRYSAQLLAEGLTSVEDVTSVVSVDI